MKICSKCKVEKPLSEFATAKTQNINRCKTCCYAKQKQWRINNPDKQRKLKRKYYEKNRKKLQEDDRKWRARPGEKQLNCRLSSTMRARIYAALKDICKSASTLSLLNCSVEQLKAHLEKQFLPGMSWENYGYRGWHVDHIKPCAKFDLTDPAQQRECFHYTNLQPLWATDNFTKNAKYAGD